LYIKPDSDLLYSNGTFTTIGDTPKVMSAARTEPAQFISLSLPSDADRAMTGPFLSWVVAIWFIGVTAFALRLLDG